jgi:putative transposase
MFCDPPARLRTQKRAIAIPREAFGGKAASARVIKMALAYGLFSRLVPESAMTALFNVSFMYSAIDTPLLIAASRKASFSHLGKTISKRSDFMIRNILRNALDKSNTLRNNLRMLIQKSYKFRFYPSKQQAEQLAVEFGHARYVWNFFLRQRSQAYKELGLSLNYVANSKYLTAMKKAQEWAWLNDCSSTVLGQKLNDLETAFGNFFKGWASYPKFKKKLHAQSIRYQLDQRQVFRTYKAGELLKLPKLGELKIKWSQIPAGTPKMVTVSKTAAGDYYIAFMCEVEQAAKPKTTKSVGLDVGIKDVLVTSDGDFSGAPKFTYKYARQLRKAQRVLSRRTKGSNRWDKQRIVVAKIHEKIGNCRRDFLHKLTSKIVAEYDYISVEDLNVKGMLQNRKLSKAVADVGIFELNRQLAYKTGWYGKDVTVISRWFPSTKTCSSCGQVHEMKLSDRVMNCDCGLNLDRDLNAAINIKWAGNVQRGEANQLIGEAKASQNKALKKRENKTVHDACMEQAA